MKSSASLRLIILLTLFLLALRLPAAAQTPAWQSAQAVAVATSSVVGTYANVTATAVDVAGNVYVAGSFTNMVTLGSTTLTSLGQDDVFIAKFNPVTNQFVWAQRAGGTGVESPFSLAVSGTGVFVAGYFSSATVGFGSTTLNNAGSGGDVFVAKLTDTGSFAWAQRAGGTGPDVAYGIATNGPNVYVAGYSGNPYAMFVTKFTDAGSVVWTQQTSGAEAHALAVIGNNIYVTGTLSGSATFGTIALTSVGFNDLFVAKITDAGLTSSFIWAQRAGGTTDDKAFALAVSGTSVYVTGSFDSPTANFGATTLTNVSNSYDVFVAKLTDAGPTGSFVWAQRAGGPGIDSANGLTVNGSSVYLVGSSSGATASFGATTLTQLGGEDVFVAKLTDAGPTSSFAWALQAGGTNFERANGVVISGTKVYVAGVFSSSRANFGATALVCPSSSAFGFLASLTDPTLTSTTSRRALASAQLFPNPAHYTATLRLPAGTAPAPLTLTDTQGRAVRQYPVPAGSEATLDLRGLPAGLYLLRGAGAAQRLVVE